MASNSEYPWYVDTAEDAVRDSKHPEDPSNYPDGR